MRARHDVVGEEIRRNRRAEGHTQEGLAHELGVDRTTVGKWERGTAWPSAKNLRALVNRRLLDASTLRRACDSRADWHVLPPALTERVAITFGREVSELRALVPQVLEDAEVVLVSFFRTVSVEQQRAVLEIITSMNTTVVPRR